MGFTHFDLNINIFNSNSLRMQFKGISYLYIFLIFDYMNTLPLKFFLDQVIYIPKKWHLLITTVRQMTES